MSLLSRPWFRLGAVGAATLVGLIVYGVVASSRDVVIALPYRDSLISEPHVMPEWDDADSRGRYRGDGLELLVKRPHRAATAEPNIWYGWDLRVAVTIEFRSLGERAASDDALPTAGVLCLGDDWVYDVRVASDGRYQIHRWEVGDVVLLASNVTLGKPALALAGPFRMVVECQRREPTTVRLRVGKDDLLTVTTDRARRWGTAALILQSGASRDVTAVFRDLEITGR